MIDWTSPAAYAGPLRFTQIELFKMMGFNLSYILDMWPD